MRLILIKHIRQVIVLLTMVFYSLISYASEADNGGWIPLSDTTQSAATDDTISAYLAEVIQNDIVPIISICASFFCLYKALTGVFSSYSHYQRDKDSAAFKESLITSFIFLGISAAIIYYIIAQMVV